MKSVISCIYIYIYIYIYIHPLWYFKVPLGVRVPPFEKHSSVMLELLVHPGPLLSSRSPGMGTTEARLRMENMEVKDEWQDEDFPKWVSFISPSPPPSTKSIIIIIYSVTLFSHKILVQDPMCSIEGNIICLPPHSIYMVDSPVMVF